MAILDRPLYGDEARGRVKNLLVFIKRVANLGYSGPDPPERFVINQLKAYKQTHGFEREGVKLKFQEGVAEWKTLTLVEKAAYWASAVGLQTNFNVFMKEYLTAEEEEEEMIVGGIIPYGGATAPDGYLLCNGAAVSRATYAALFVVTGIAFGAGDGTTTFNLPDLRQKFPLGKAAAGTGAVLGETAGEMDHFHTDTGHTHTLEFGYDLVGVEYPSEGKSIQYSYSNTGGANPPFQVVNYLIKF